MVKYEYATNLLPTTHSPARGRAPSRLQWWAEQTGVNVNGIPGKHYFSGDDRRAGAKLGA